MEWPISWNDVKEKLDNGCGDYKIVYLDAATYGLSVSTTEQEFTAEQLGEEFMTQLTKWVSDKNCIIRFDTSSAKNSFWLFPVSNGYWVGFAITAPTYNSGMLRTMQMAVTGTVIEPTGLSIVSNYYYMSRYIIPTLPDDTNNYVLKSVAGKLTWVAE